MTHCGVFTEIKLTNGVKAVDVQACRALVSYMDLLQGVVWAVGQYDLYCNHTGLVQTWLPGEMVLGRQTFSCHMVKQLIGFQRAKRWSGDLEGHIKQGYTTGSKCGFFGVILRKQTMLTKKKSNHKKNDHYSNKLQFGQEWTKACWWLKNKNKHPTKLQMQHITQQRKASWINTKPETALYITAQMHQHKKSN